LVIWNRRNWIGAAAIVPWIGSSLLEEKSAIGLEPLEDSEPLAWTHAKILTAAGSVINDGTLVVQKGTILAVGPSNTTAIPAGAKVIDATGKWIMPGLVCTHSHIGGVGAADGSSPIQPGVRILDSINVKDAGFKRALAGGLTTLNIMPGSGHLISGQTVYCKLRFAGKGPSTIEDILIRDGQDKPLGGLKMANGTNSKGEAPFPGTRGKSAFLVREH